MTRSGVLRDGFVAGAVGAVLGGIPSTVHAWATGGDVLEATRAAGALVLPDERRLSRLLPAAAVVHTGISLFWGVVLAAGPRPRGVGAGAVVGALSGAAIAALDLGAIGRRIGPVERLALGPQIADHVAYGAAVGAVLGRRAS